MYYLKQKEALASAEDPYLAQNKER